LAILGYLTVITFLLVISSKKVSPLVSIVAVPIIFSLIGGFGLQTFSFAIDGMKDVASTFAMILFAILYFSLMMYVGLFDPIVDSIISVVKGDPLKIMVGSALLAAVVSCGGDGSTAFLITCTAMVPVFDRLKMNKLYLACVVIMENTVLNLLPWGGPMARVLSVLKVDAGQLLKMLLPSMILGIAYGIGIAYYLGLKERKRLGVTNLGINVSSLKVELSSEEKELRRPKLYWFNFILTIVVVVLLIMGILPSSMCFVVGTIIAAAVNYPDLKQQRNVIEQNASGIMNVVIMVLGAGVLMGILNGTKMSDAIGNSLVSLIPASMSRYFGVAIAFISAPGTVALSNDAFYYGVMPVLAKTAMAYGFTPLQIAFASMVGQAFHQLSPLIAAIYLLIDLTGITLEKYEKYNFKWMAGLFVIYFGCAILSGNLVLH